MEGSVVGVVEVSFLGRPRRLGVGTGGVLFAGSDNGVWKGVSEIGEGGLEGLFVSLGGKGENSSSVSLSEDKKSGVFVFVVMSSCCWGGKLFILICFSQRRFCCQLAIEKQMS